METTYLTSFIGIIVFTIIMFLGYRYANGKWKVAESKKEQYQDWTSKQGRTIKKWIIIVSIIYGILMLIQVVSL